MVGVLDNEVVRDLGRLDESSSSSKGLGRNGD